MNKFNFFIVCTGLGHVNRGYETFTRECYHALKNNERFELYLLKGGGKTTGNEIKIACLKRDSKITFFIAGIFKQNSYWVEQLTFLFGMIPSIIKRKPTVIYYSDFILGTFLWHLRRFFKFKYKLLFANGAPNGPPFKTEDHVQQVLPVYFDAAIRGGEPLSKHTLLPYGFDINVEEKLNRIGHRNQIKATLGFSPGQKIILTVGAINSSHKRMHHIINEAAKLPSDYFLVILGQFENETPQILQLAEDKLPGKCFIANVPFEKVLDYYVIADYFVLASLQEGFGRVLIEALSYGLPCIVNDYISAKQVLGEFGIYIDMEQTDLLLYTLLKDDIVVDKESRISSVYHNYSWDKLRNRYIDMISTMID